MSMPGGNHILKVQRRVSFAVGIIHYVHIYPWRYVQDASNENIILDFNKYEWKYISNRNPLEILELYISTVFSRLSLFTLFAIFNTY